MTIHIRIIQLVIISTFFALFATSSHASQNVDTELPRLIPTGLYAGTVNNDTPKNHDKSLLLTKTFCEHVKARPVISYYGTVRGFFHFRCVEDVGMSQWLAKSLSNTVHR